MHNSERQTESLDALRQLAEQGDAEAQNELGKAYLKGELVERDFNEAYSWFEKSARQGFAPAQFNLASCYEKINKDWKQATNWYLKAVEQGDPDAHIGYYRCKKMIAVKEQDFELAANYRDKEKLLMTNMKRLLLSLGTGGMNILNGIAFQIASQVELMAIDKIPAHWKLESPAISRNPMVRFVDWDKIEKWDDFIDSSLKPYQSVFVLSCLGGNTTSQIIDFVKALKERNKSVILFAVLPFEFEKCSKEQIQQVLCELKDNVDKIITISNEAISQKAPKDCNVLVVYKMIDNEVLRLLLSEIQE